MGDVSVTRNEARNRFETTVDGSTAFLDYRLDGDRIVLIHTEVPSALEGRGIGGQIVKAALAYVRDNDLIVVPQCPFVKSYLERHPDEAKTLRVAGHTSGDAT